MHTIINRFHNTSVRVRDISRVKQAIFDIAMDGKPSAKNKALVKRLKVKLCGSPDCICGDTIGARPDLDVQWPER
jgi:hypothetical protein